MRSRWTMPSACASAMATHACRTNSTACSTGSGPRCSQRRGEIAALQVLHHHVGRAVLERPHVEHAGHVLALDLDGGARLARGSAATASSCSASPGSRNLMATARRAAMWCAATTTPIPPSPSTRSTRYLPARTSPERTPFTSTLHSGVQAGDQRSYVRAPTSGSLPRATIGRAASGGQGRTHAIRHDLFLPPREPIHCLERPLLGAATGRFHEAHGPRSVEARTPELPPPAFTGLRHPWARFADLAPEIFY